MYILPVRDQNYYSETLLAMGVAAAFNVFPSYHGGAFTFPDTGDEPIQFPYAALEGETEQPPFSYHRFKASAIKALGGAQMVDAISRQWNDTEPTYQEVMPLICALDEPNWKSTRFAVGKLWSGAATFRPQAAKGAGSTKADGTITADTIRDFWLKEALRAIGFLTFAATKLLMREAQVARWLIFVPCVPDVRFTDQMLHQPDLESAARTQLMAHIIASRLQIPRLFVQQYAELNPLARTPFQHFGLETMGLSADTLSELEGWCYALGNYNLQQQTDISRWMLDVLAHKDIRALSKINMRIFETTKNNRFIRPLSESAIDDLLTCVRIVDANQSEPA